MIIFLNIILLLVAFYLICGLIFAVLFLGRGINKTDEGAHGSGIGFKLIITPGVMVFWPVLLKRWRNSQ